MFAQGASSSVKVLDFRTRLTRITRRHVQGIERELSSLPGSYATDAGGAMLLAYERTPSTASGSSSSGSEVNDPGSEGESSEGSGGSEVCVGAVALRRLAGHTSTVAPGELVAGVPLERVCEMKRLFVLPGHHGLGVGAALVRALLAEGALLGYQVGGRGCGWC